MNFFNLNPQIDVNTSGPLSRGRGLAQAGGGMMPIKRGKLREAKEIR